LAPGSGVLNPDSCRAEGRPDLPRQQILARLIQRLHKNVTNFADKRDKGLPLSYRVGLAYMVLATVKLKKCGIFFAGYFGESGPGDLLNLRKSATPIQF
jgi:hypothetical protein